MKLKKFQQVQKDILTALEAVGKKHNVTFSYGGGTYIPDGSEEDTFRIKAIENTASGQPRDFAREAYLNYLKEWKAPHVGFLKKEWLDKTFRDGRHDYTVVGYAPGKTNCIVTKRDDGKTYYWSVEAVKQHMKTAA
jgi:hypothetical protein